MAEQGEKRALEQIVELAAEVRLKEDTYRDLQRAEDVARSRATDALNRLNEAQRAFDEVTAQARKESPRGTDWHDRAYRRLTSADTSQ